MIKIISKIQYAFKNGGLKTFLSQSYGFLKTRLLLLIFMALPESGFRSARDAVCIGIIKKQSGDIASIDMLGYLIPELNNVHPDKDIKVVLQRYLIGAFELIRPILADGRVRLSVVDEYEHEHDPDLILCNLLMINQVSHHYSDVIREMEIVYQSSTYIIFCKPDIVDAAIRFEGNIDEYVEIVAGNNNKGAITHVDVNGYTFAVRQGTMDHAIINEVKHEYLDRLLTDGFTGKNVIDLGAHIGSFSVQISKYLQANAKIICIEPSPYNVELIRENIEINKLGKVVEAKQVAVSSKSGKATLFISADNTGGNKLDMVEPSSTESVDVDVITLSDIINEFGGEDIDVLKIDVEGSEQPILFPNRELLRTKVKMIIGEAGGSVHGDGMSVVNFLQDLGFLVDYEGNAAQLIFIAKNESFI